MSNYLAGRCHLNIANQYITMKNIFFFPLFSLVLWACGHNQHRHGDTDEHSHAGSKMVDGLIVLSPSQMKLAAPEYTNFVKRAISEELQVNAELVVHQEHTAELTAFSDGILASLNTSLNASVRKGQVLATVRKPDLLDLQQQYLENRDRLVFLQAEYQRYKLLKDADATALKNFQKAESELQAAQTTAQVFAAKLRQYQIDPEKLTPANLSTHLSLTAPLGGIVTAIYTNAGAAVQPGTSVCEVTDLSQLHADLWIFEKDILKIKNGQRVFLTFPAEPSKAYSATIYSIDKVLHPEKRAVRAHARLEGSPGEQANFVKGAFLEARIVTSSDDEATALPEAALVQEGGEDFIFTLEKENTAGSFFRKIKVQRGSIEEGFVAVRPMESLPEDAKIVLKGVYYVSAQGAEIEADH